MPTLQEGEGEVGGGGSGDGGRLQVPPASPQMKPDGVVRAPPADQNNCYHNYNNNFKKINSSLSANSPLDLIAWASDSCTQI